MVFHLLPSIPKAFKVSLPHFVSAMQRSALQINGMTERLTPSDDMSDALQGSHHFPLLPPHRQTPP